MKKVLVGLVAMMLLFAPMAFGLTIVDRSVVGEEVYTMELIFLLLPHQKTKITYQMKILLL